MRLDPASLCAICDPTKMVTSRTADRVNRIFESLPERAHRARAALRRRYAVDGICRAGVTFIDWILDPIDEYGTTPGAGSRGKR